MASTSSKSYKKNVKAKIAAAQATAAETIEPVIDVVTTTIQAPPQTPKEEPPATPTIAPKPDPNATQEEAHFDVAQNAYGTVKNIWSWGKTIPIITSVLSLTETVAAKFLDVTVHMDLPAIDQKGVTPQLKKLDDDVVSPVILAIWKILEPAVKKGEEMVVKPVMEEIVPRVMPVIMGPLSLFHGGDKKKKGEEKEKKDVIDSSPAPVMVPALN